MENWDFTTLNSTDGTKDKSNSADIELKLRSLNFLYSSEGKRVKGTRWYSSDGQWYLVVLLRREVKFLHPGEVDLDEKEEEDQHHLLTLANSSGPKFWSACHCNALAPDPF